MGKLKNLDRAQYKDTYEAIFSLMEESSYSCHRDNGFINIYSQDALDMALLYLCANDISHTYCIRPLDFGFGTNEVRSIVSIQWIDEDGERSCIFFSDIILGTEEDDYEVC
jgi:hypothetical protein